MGDNSGDEFDEKWVFYRDRPEWKDVQPIPQDDGSAPVVAIAYSEQFKDVYDYFRAILKSSEKSERALDLTRDAALLNPANYTVWLYRREILKALNKDLKEELNYIYKCILDTPKNYQVWHHRRVLIEWLQDGSEELKLTENVLHEDAKNYHAWQHRQWAIKTFNLFDGELNYVDKLLDEDIRNNSAWNQRYFVINNSTGFTEDVLKREIVYTLAKINKAKENESAWSYLRGLLIQISGGLSQNEEVTKFCENLFEAGVRSPYLLALIVDMCDDQISQNNFSHPKYNVKRALELCSDLATKYDVIREKYWEHMAKTIQNKTEAESSQL